MAFKSTLLFDVLGNILVHKSESLYENHIQRDDWKTVSKFILLKYLTMSQDKRVRDMIASDYGTWEKIPEKQLYKILMNVVPKQKSTFIRFIK